MSEQHDNKINLLLYMYYQTVPLRVPIVNDHLSLLADACLATSDRGQRAVLEQWTVALVQHSTVWNQCAHNICLRITNVDVPSWHPRQEKRSQ